jgi:pyridoxamine 5'-phosphate oxidase
MSNFDQSRPYLKSSVADGQLAADPFAQFALWFGQAAESEPHEANAMILATAASDGQPSARTVLLKRFDERGFVFFSNYDSRKGRELQLNPQAALLFYWPSLERQVRIEGAVERLPQQESAEYFNSRPEGSRLGAWASPQSEPVADRVELEARYLETAGRFPAGEVPLPPFWGGYLVVPERLEFWQGRQDRLHDRFLYRRSEAVWVQQRLAP